MPATTTTMTRHEPADPEPDRDRGLALGILLALADEDPRAARHLGRQGAQVPAHAPRRGRSSAVEEQAAGGLVVVLGELDQRDRPAPRSCRSCGRSRSRARAGRRSSETSSASSLTCCGYARSRALTGVGRARGVRLDVLADARSSATSDVCRRLVSVSACWERKATRPASRWPVAATIRTTSVAPSSTATVALSTSTRVVIRVLRLRRSTSVDPPSGRLELYSRVRAAGAGPDGGSVVRRKGTACRIEVHARCVENHSVSRRILIVDDHTTFRTIVRAVLEADGYDVVG